MNSRRFLGFVHRGQTYRYKVLPMGVRNGPAFFTLYLRDLFWKYFGGNQQWFTNYQDDIFIGADSIEEREKRMEVMKEFCDKMALPINPKKVEFSDSSEGIKILGVMVKNGRLTLPIDKENKIVEVIEEICGRGTATKRQFYAVLGKLNFFRALGQGFAEIIQPIYDELKNYSSWDQQRRVTEEMNRILRRIQSELPQWSTNTIVGDVIDIKIDSSKYGAGGICYDAKNLKKPIHNWSVCWVDESNDSTLIELRGLREFLARNRQWILGTPASRWRIFSDSLNLIRYMTCGSRCEETVKRKVIEKIQQLIRELGVAPEYHHIKGTDNFEADKLSRQQKG